MLRGLIILVLLAATAFTAVVWVRSYEGSELVRYRRGEFDLYAYGEKGACLCFFTVKSDGLFNWLPSNMEIGSFAIIDMRASMCYRSRRPKLVVFPFWFPSLLLAAYPCYAIAKSLVRPYCRRKSNLCCQCGYNLTGNESGQCPECGYVADSPVAS